MNLSKIQVLTLNETLKINGGQDCSCDEEYWKEVGRRLRSGFDFVASFF